MALIVVWCDVEKY